MTADTSRHSADASACVWPYLHCLQAADSAADIWACLLVCLQGGFPSVSTTALQLCCFCLPCLQPCLQLSLLFTSFSAERAIKQRSLHTRPRILLITKSHTVFSLCVTTLNISSHMHFKRSKFALSISYVCLPSQPLNQDLHLMAVKPPCHGHCMTI